MPERNHETALRSLNKGKLRRIVESKLIELAVKVSSALELVDEVKLGNEWAWSGCAPGFSSKIRINYAEAEWLSKYFDVVFCVKYFNYDPLAAHFRVYKKGTVDSQGNLHGHLVHWDKSKDCRLWQGVSVPNRKFYNIDGSKKEKLHAGKEVRKSN